MLAPSAIGVWLNPSASGGDDFRGNLLMVQKFINGAVRCQKAGVDGVLPTPPMAI